MGQVIEEEDPPKEGEVLPPKDDEEHEAGSGELNILALIENYTNRPDLFLSEVEKFDPGFTKRFNESAHAHSEQLRNGKYRFGKWQAYTSLGLQSLSIIIIFLITTQAKRNLSSRSGIGGVRNAT